MKIHTDTLTENDLYRALPTGVYPERLEAVGSRKRDHGFEVSLDTSGGADRHGIKRVYSRNSGMYGAVSLTRAATYIEWGDWMIELFKIDPDAIIGQYSGLPDFLYQTTRMAPNRPARENAVEHAERWAKETATVENAVL